MSLHVKTPAVHAVLKGMAAGGRGYGISHSWEGTVLTVTSDSGTSAADLVGPAGALLLVTVTECEDGTYAADKTYGDIAAAVERGDLVLTRVVMENGNELYGQLGVFSPQLASFSTYMEYGALNLCLFCHVFADDRVEITYPPAEEEMLPYLVTVTKAGDTVTVKVSYSDFHDEDTVLTLDEKGVPVSVTRNGDSCTLDWEGFDETL